MWMKYAQVLFADSRNACKFENPQQADGPEISKEQVECVAKTPKN